MPCAPTTTMYKPSQRQVEVEMLAPAGWVQGLLHVPMRSALLPFLNKAAEFLPMTCVQDGERGDFLAVRRKAIVLMLPEARDLEERGQLQPGTYEPCRVRCLFTGGSVEGTIQVLNGQRMSDFLESNCGFLHMTDCVLALEDGSASSSVPHVVLNAAHVLAVADLSGRDHAPIASLLEAVGAR